MDNRGTYGSPQVANGQFVDSFSPNSIIDLPWAVKGKDPLDVAECRESICSIGKGENGVKNFTRRAA